MDAVLHVPHYMQDFGLVRAWVELRPGFVYQRETYNVQLCKPQNTLDRTTLSDAICFSTVHTGSRESKIYNAFMPSNQRKKRAKIDSMSGINCWPRNCRSVYLARPNRYVA